MENGACGMWIRQYPFSVISILNFAVNYGESNQRMNCK